MEHEMGGCAEMNQLFIEIEIDANIWQHKISHKFPIEIEHAPCLCKRRAAVLKRWREQPDLL